MLMLIEKYLDILSRGWILLLQSAKPSKYINYTKPANHARPSKSINHTKSANHARSSKSASIPSSPIKKLVLLLITIVLLLNTTFVTLAIVLYALLALMIDKIMLLAPYFINH
jgi:hypothetical protein